MIDPIDEIIEKARCPGGFDCDCESFLCSGFVRAVAKAARRELALEILGDLVLVQERFGNSLVLQVITKLREIAGEE